MYYVSRQCRWPDGKLLVEIVSGGLDHAGADMLTPRFPGEGQEYADPREAVEVAVRICAAWREVSTRAEWPRLAYGSTLGGICETEPCSFSAARKAAKATWEALEKCERCGEPLPDKRKRFRANDWDGLEYCSSDCAERAAEWEEEQQRLLDGEEDVA